jgi:hypothetical protein
MSNLSQLSWFDYLEKTKDSARILSRSHTVSAWPKARTVYLCPKTRTAVSNPAQGTDVCTNFYVLCCPVYVQALRMADPPSKEAYQISKDSYFQNELWVRTGQTARCVKREK